ncbi:MAG: aminotransferase class I/II-fold pyridoxal phosphate-dependent enzyme [Candidatus Endolissoclinum sp.]|nr:aminotransferase class I/II-fold pyridoxal phosphate-dependent enzyme [Candidatus Endolissoclinum sp.]
MKKNLSPETAVHSFCPTQIRRTLDKILIKNKGSQTELDDYHNNWLNWTSRFNGVDKFSDWAVCNGIHDALVTQIAYRSKTVNKFYYFEDDYKFYSALLSPYTSECIHHTDLETIEENSYIIVSQPNHTGSISTWFPELKKQCEKTNSKIFLDCAFYGTSLETMSVYEPVIDCVAFSLSKNFLLAGIRAGVIFGNDLSPVLTIPISKLFSYNYYNINAVTVGNAILSEFGPLYITAPAKMLQEEYVNAHPDYTALEIWMWVADEHGNKICITDEIQDGIQSILDKEEKDGQRK